MSCPGRISVFGFETEFEFEFILEIEFELELVLEVKFEFTSEFEIDLEFEFEIAIELEFELAVALNSRHKAFAFGPISTPTGVQFAPRDPQIGPRSLPNRPQESAPSGTRAGPRKRPLSATESKPAHREGQSEETQGWDHPVT